MTLLVAQLPNTNPEGCLCTSLLGAFALALLASELSSNKSVLAAIFRPVFMLPLNTVTVPPARCCYVLCLQHEITGLTATSDGLHRWKHPSSCCTLFLGRSLWCRSVVCRGSVVGLALLMVFMVLQ